MIARHFINARDKAARIYGRTIFDPDIGLANFVKWLHEASPQIQELSPTRIVTGCDDENYCAPRVAYRGPENEMAPLVAVARWYLRSREIGAEATASTEDCVSR